MNLIQVFSVAMLIALCGLFATRLLPWGKGRGIGRRAIQFLAVAVIAPGIIILRLDNVVDNQVLIAVVSAIFGFTAGLASGGRDEA